MAFKTEIVAAGIVSTTVNGQTSRRVQVSKVLGGQMVLWTHPGEDIESRIYHLPKPTRDKMEAVRQMIGMPEFSKQDKAWLKKVECGEIPLQVRKGKEEEEAPPVPVKGKKTVQIAPGESVEALKAALVEADKARVKAEAALKRAKQASAKEATKSQAPRKAPTRNRQAPSENTQTHANAA